MELVPAIDQFGSSFGPFGLSVDWFLPVGPVFNGIPVIFQEACNLLLYAIPFLVLLEIVTEIRLVD